MYNRDNQEEREKIICLLSKIGAILRINAYFKRLI